MVTKNQLLVQVQLAEQLIEAYDHFNMLRAGYEHGNGTRKAVKKAGRKLGQARRAYDLFKEAEFHASEASFMEDGS